MSLLQNMTIRHKLTAIIMVTSVLALTLATAAFTLRDWIGARNNMLSKLSSHAAVMAEACNAALAFEDAHYARKVLSALNAEPSISYAGVFTKEGEALATYRRSWGHSVVESVRPIEKGHRFRRNALDLVTDVRLDGETIGTLFIRADLREHYAELLNHRRLAGVAFFTLTDLPLLSYYRFSHKALLLKHFCVLQ